MFRCSFFECLSRLSMILWLWLWFLVLISLLRDCCYLLVFFGLLLRGFWEYGFWLCMVMGEFFVKLVGYVKEMGSDMGSFVSCV